MPAAVTSVLLFSGSPGQIYDGEYIVARDWRVKRALRKHYLELYGKHPDGVTVATPVSIQYAKRLWQQLVDGSTPYDEKLFWGVLSAMNSSVDFRLEQNLPGLFTLLRKNFGLRQVVLSALKLQQEPQSSPVKKSIAEKQVEVRTPLRKSASTGELQRRLEARPGLAETIGKSKLAGVKDDFLVGLFYHCPASANAQFATVLTNRVLGDPRLADVVLTNGRLRNKVNLTSGDIGTLITNVGLVKEPFEADRYFEHLFRQVLVDPSYFSVLRQSKLLEMVSGTMVPAAVPPKSLQDTIDKIKEYFYGAVVQDEEGRFKSKSFTCRLGLMECLLDQPQLFVTLAGTGTPPAHLMDLLNLAFDSPSTLLSFVKSLGEKPETRNFILENIGHIVVTLERQGFPRKSLNALLRTKVTDSRRSVKLGDQLHQWICNDSSDALLEQLGNDYVRGKVNLSAEECLGILGRVGRSEDGSEARQKILSLVMLADSNLLNKLGSYRERHRHSGAILSSAIYYYDERQVVQKHLTDIMRGDLRAISVNGMINPNYALVIASDPHLWARITSRRRGWFGFKESFEQWSTRVQAFKGCSPIFQKKQELDNDGLRHSALGTCKLLVEHANSLSRRVAASPIHASPEGASGFVPVSPPSSELSGAASSVVEALPHSPPPESHQVSATPPARIVDPILASTARILDSMSDNVEELSRKLDLEALNSENFADMVKKYEHDPKFLQAVVGTTAIFQRIALGGDIVACGKRFLSVVFNGDIQAFAKSGLLRECNDVVYRAITQSYEAVQEEEQLIRSRPADLSRLLSGNLDEELMKRRANDLVFWVDAVANPKLFSTIGEAGVTQFVQKVLLGKSIEFVASIFNSCYLDSLEKLIAQHTRESMGKMGGSELINFWRHVIQDDRSLRDRITADRFITSVLIKINGNQIEAILDRSDKVFCETVFRMVLRSFKARPACERSIPQVLPALRVVMQAFQVADSHSREVVRPA